MSLYSDVLSSILKSDNNIILRSDFKGIGSNSNVSAVISRLIKNQVIIRISRGVFVKTKVSSLSNKVIPVASLETLTPEILQRLGIKATPSRLADANSKGQTSQLQGKFTVNTGSKVVTRAIEVGGRKLYFENERNFK